MNLNELVYLKDDNSYFVAIDAEGMYPIDDEGVDEDEVWDREGRVVPWSMLPHYVQSALKESTRFLQNMNVTTSGGNAKGITFCKYQNGQAYYYVADWENGGPEVKLIHLIGGSANAYDAYKRQLKRVSWEEIPESFRLDAIANNPFIRENYGRQGSYKTKEGDSMFDAQTNDMFDFGRFGQMKTDDVVMSPKGLAIKMTTKNGKVKYRSWDKDKNRMVDVTGLTMAMAGMLFVMPARKLDSGDIIEHDGEYVFIKDVEADGSFVILNGSGELAEHLKTTSFMGFDFYRKVVTPMKRFGDSSGGIMGMMKMQMMSGMMGGNTEGGGMQQMMMFQMMTGKGGMDDMFDMDGMFDFSDDEAEEEDDDAILKKAASIKAARTRAKNKKK